MANYAEVAVQAFFNISVGRQISARAAWAIAVTDAFPNSVSMQEKGCPKTIFLTLCASGALVGVAATEGVGKSQNARHARDCLALLDKHPGYVDMAPRKLWSLVTNASGKAYNQQMHVILGLAKAGLLR
jgi:hypothetical protein